MMTTSSIRERPTPDLIVIFLAGIIGTVVVGTLLLAVISLARNPTADITSELRFVADVTTSLMTGVIGYIGGRATATRETSHPPDEPSPEEGPQA